MYQLSVIGVGEHFQKLRIDVASECSDTAIGHTEHRDSLSWTAKTIRRPLQTKILGFRTFIGFPQSG